MGSPRDSFYSDTTEVVGHLHLGLDSLRRAVTLVRRKSQSACPQLYFAISLRSVTLSSDRQRHAHCLSNRSINEHLPLIAVRLEAKSQK